MKPIRAKDILARLIDARPDEESYSEFSKRIGSSKIITVEDMNRRKDVTSGWMYRIAKAFGYQILFYKPNPHNGLEKIYTIGEKRAPIKAREKKSQARITVDTYTGQKYRYVRKYKRKKKGFVKVNSNGR